MLALLAVWLLAQVNSGYSLFAATFHPGPAGGIRTRRRGGGELTQTAAADRHPAVHRFTMRRRWLGGVALVLVIGVAVLMKTAAQAVLKPVAWDEWLRPATLWDWRPGLRADAAVLAAAPPNRSSLALRC